MFLVLGTIPKTTFISTLKSPSGEFLSPEINRGLKEHLVNDLIPNIRRNEIRI